MTRVFRFFLARAHYRNRLARVACGAPGPDRMASARRARDVASDQRSALPATPC